MNVHDVIIVRIYSMESEHRVKQVVDYLKEAHIRGVSVFRAIGGYGDTGEHTASLVELSLNLPLVIEFFDIGEKVQPVLEYLSKVMPEEHLVFWQASANGFVA